ncbi:Putative pterin-4-alpha-carbinolamine dehydratase [Polystyrenella longa]|uniref:4a-hydroxytetrahydrobiopterin dehydratase n=1 Tax=Polystyrenella longa TaxID=2528007 RepID=A0A518CKY2_9PLAN|nr:4a-hydroxytetrahydrobiopterin dehydratase [Polystyrenella longa]QDU79890.1 Putative pterin-4-alpha-carbinolamine dehydratase [Polystyrenella longa]
MADKEVLTEEQIAEHLKKIPEWKLQEGWITRVYKTPGFPHTLLVANTIGYMAEAADHHPDLELGYARAKVKLQTHSAKGITMKDIELATQIEHSIGWKPGEDSALEGKSKNWVK